MTGTPYLIRPAVPEDAAALAAIARRVFLETFGPANRAEDIEAYVGRAYGEAQQRKELEAPEGIALLLFDQGQLAGFAQLRRDVSPPFRSFDAAVEIARFYIDPPWHGRGAAQQLMDAVEETARKAGARVLWLGVWEHNPRAIAFYEKRGFRDIGSQPFLLGSDLQTDRVMEKVLG